VDESLGRRQQLPTSIDGAATRCFPIDSDGSHCGLAIYHGQGRGARCSRLENLGKRKGFTVKLAKNAGLTVGELLPALARLGRGLGLRSGLTLTLPCERPTNQRLAKQGLQLASLSDCETTQCLERQYEVTLPKAALYRISSALPAVHRSLGQVVRSTRYHLVASGVQDTNDS
jgi:hypothetical protein